MKPTNLNPPGSKAATIVRGLSATNRAGAGPTLWTRPDGTEYLAWKVQASSVMDLGDDEVQIGGENTYGYTNATGGPLAEGDVVVIVGTTAIATTTAQDTRPVGVVIGGGDDGDEVVVQTSGHVSLVNVTAAVTAGYFAETSTTAGDATESATRRTGSFGTYLAAGTTPSALLFGVTDTSSSGGLLTPEATIVATKAAGNPTFNFDAIPESIVKVGATYYCSYMDSTGGGGIRLATAANRDGPWTSGASIFSTPGWAGGYNMYSPEIMEHGGTFYIFFSTVDVNGRGSIGVCTATTVTGPYTDSGSAILDPGAASTPTSRRVGEPSVIVQSGQWIMAFMGEDEDIAYQSSEQVFLATAVSATGPWTVLNSGSPVLAFGTSGEWDDTLVADPFLFYLNGYLWIMYAGGGAAASPHRPWQQGLAYALPSALTTWTRMEGNPFLTVGAIGQWDESSAWRGSVWIEDGAIGGVYGGYTSAFSYKGGNFRIAVSSSGALALRAVDIPIDDAGGYYSGAEVETALQEIGADLEILNAGGVGHWEVVVSGSAPPVAVSTPSNDDWVYGFVPD